MGKPSGISSNSQTVVSPSVLGFLSFSRKKTQKTGTLATSNHDNTLIQMGVGNCKHLVSQNISRLNSLAKRGRPLPKIYLLVLNLFSIIFLFDKITTRSWILPSTPHHLPMHYICFFFPFFFFPGAMRRLAENSCQRHSENNTSVAG